MVDERTFRHQIVRQRKQYAEILASAFLNAAEYDAEVCSMSGETDEKTNIRAVKRVVRHLLPSLWPDNMDVLTDMIERLDESRDWLLPRRGLSKYIRLQPRVNNTQTENWLRMWAKRAKLDYLASRDNSVGGRPGGIGQSEDVGEQ